MSEKDEKERVEFGRHWGDWSIPFIALLFLAGFLALIFSNPLAGLDKTDEVLNRIQAANKAKAEEEARQRDIHDAEATGVVTVGIGPKKKQ